MCVLLNTPYSFHHLYFSPFPSLYLLLPSLFTYSSITLTLLPSLPFNDIPSHPFLHKRPLLITTTPPPFPGATTLISPQFYTTISLPIPFSPISFRVEALSNCLSILSHIVFSQLCALPQSPSLSLSLGFLCPPLPNLSSIYSLFILPSHPFLSPNLPFSVLPCQVLPRPTLSSALSCPVVSYSYPVLQCL